MKLIFIRHAEPDYSIDSLTEKGWREAKLLAKRTADWKVAAFYCSPLGRALDTASFTLKEHNAEATVYPWLQEFVYRVADPVTGKPRIAWDFMPEYFTNEELLYDKNNWMNADIIRNSEVYEHYVEVCEGFDSILKKHGYEREGAYYRVREHNDDTIVFFCHLGLSYVLISHLLGISPVVMWQGFFTAPSSVTIFGSEERDPGIASFRCQVLGDTTHLHDGGEPISSSGYYTDAYQL